MSDAPALCLTVSAAYRSGSEVLLTDSGPLPDLTAVREALSEIDGSARYPCRPAVRARRRAGRPRRRAAV